MAPRGRQNFGKRRWRSCCRARRGWGNNVEVTLPRPHGFSHPFGLSLSKPSRCTSTRTATVQCPRHPSPGPLRGKNLRCRWHLAIITHSADTRQMLDHIGGQAEPQNILPACRPPLREDSAAPVSEGIESVPDWYLAGQPVPDLEFDQYINW
jgi:hypothetical protein